MRKRDLTYTCITSLALKAEVYAVTIFPRSLKPTCAHILPKTSKFLAPPTSNLLFTNFTIT